MASFQSDPVQRQSSQGGHQVSGVEVCQLVNYHRALKKKKGKSVCVGRFLGYVK